MGFVDTRSDGHVLVIRINRPEKYNALNVAMYHELAQAYAMLGSDPNLRVAVLCAEGKHFTAGIELDEWAPIFRSGQSFPVAAGEIDPMGVNGPLHSKPVVIAVQGYCFTWGVEILLNSEIRIASRETQFQMLEVQRGLYPCGGATLRLPREIGWGNAQRVLLTGERWSAEQALRWGMVQELVEPGEQVNRALENCTHGGRCRPAGGAGLPAGNPLCTRARPRRVGHADDAGSRPGDDQRGRSRRRPFIHRTAQGCVCRQIAAAAAGAAVATPAATGINSA